jgi:ribosomal protein L37E
MKYRHRERIEAIHLFATPRIVATTTAPSKLASHGGPGASVNFLVSLTRNRTIHVSGRHCEQSEAIQTRAANSAACGFSATVRDLSGKAMKPSGRDLGLGPDCFGLFAMTRFGWEIGSKIRS